MIVRVVVVVFIVASAARDEGGVCLDLVDRSFAFQRTLIYGHHQDSML